MTYAQLQSEIANYWKPRSFWIEGRPFDRLLPDRTIPRNVPCPCGSGRKYKQCHGRFVEEE